MKAFPKSFGIATVTLILYFSFPFILKGQENESQKDYYIWFDQTIGKTNSGAFYGIDYVEQFKVIGNRHKFFLKPNFIKGSMTYDGQPYYDLDLKYGVYGDQLLVRHPGIIGSTVIQMIKGLVSGFEIEGHRFVNMNTTESESVKISGFLEVLVTNDSVSLFKKHLKRILKKSDQEAVYYEFKDRHAYYLQFQDNFYEIEKLQDIMGLFPDYKKQIKDIGNRYDALGKEGEDAFFVAVLTDFIPILTNIKKEL